MLEAQCAYHEMRQAKLPVLMAVPAKGSQMLDKIAENRRVERFPMWDWVGGRAANFRLSVCCASGAQQRRHRPGALCAARRNG